MTGEMLNYECAKCGNNDFILFEKEFEVNEEKRKHIGLKCANCDKWLKWIRKEEYKRIVGDRGANDN